MKHNILKGATPATVLWHPIPMSDADRDLVEFVQDAIRRTREFWPEKLPHEAEAIYQWWPLNGDAIARLCNYVMGVKGMIDREPISKAFTESMRLAYSDAMHRADRKLSLLLAQVMDAENATKQGGER